MKKKHYNGSSLSDWIGVTGETMGNALAFLKPYRTLAMQKVTALTITLIICAVVLFMMMLLDSAFSRGMTAFGGIGPIAGLLLVMAVILSCWQYCFNRLLPERDYRPFLGVVCGVLLSYLIFEKVVLPELSGFYAFSFLVLEFSLRMFLITSVYMVTQRVGEWIRER